MPAQPAQFTPTTLHGQPVIHVSTRDGAQATLSLFGGQLLHWQPAGGKPWLYLSEQARFDGTHAIRGGTPVCFPQFAQRGKLPRHGLVRTAPWRLIEHREHAGDVMLTVGTDSTDETRAAWAFDFALELTVNVGGNRLDVEFSVTNTGYSSFAFAAALHTYLRVAEVELAQLEGLSGYRYQDANDGDSIKADRAETFAVDAPIDRIYRDAPRTLQLFDNGRRLSIVQEQFPDTVVWNPWEDGARALDDMPDSDFRRMLCIEAAAAQRIELGADETWWGRQSLIEER